MLVLLLVAVCSAAPQWSDTGANTAALLNTGPIQQQQYAGNHLDQQLTDAASMMNYMFSVEDLNSAPDAYDPEFRETNMQDDLKEGVRQRRKVKGVFRWGKRTMEKSGPEDSLIQHVGQAAESMNEVRKRNLSYYQRWRKLKQGRAPKVFRWGK